MKLNKTYRTSIAAAGMIVLILDSKNVTAGAIEGIKMCLNVVIPALLPYFIFSNFITSTLNNTGSLQIIGLIGGYPAGAQAVKTAYDLGLQSKSDAARMLAYCNNAGPAFIFGMLSRLFTKAYAPWILWAIHIISSEIVHIIFSKKQQKNVRTNNQNSIGFTDCIDRSVKAISLVCCWVFFFKIILTVLDQRLLKSCPCIIKIILSGILELTNGCNDLFLIPSESLRFILSSAFIGFGGICVMFQTASITKELGIKFYMLGKCIQCMVSIILSVLAVSLVY